MKATIEITMDGRAFEKGNDGRELARILEELAEDIKRRSGKMLTSKPIWDKEGDLVGKFDVIE